MKLLDAKCCLNAAIKIAVISWFAIVSFSTQSIASSYSGYDCNALNPQSSWNCPCGCGYTMPGPTPPPDCEQNFTSTTNSTVGGPHNECNITTYNNRTTYTCPMEYFPDDYSTSTSYNCKLTAADCSPGETFLQYNCSCTAGAPSCVVSGSTAVQPTTVASADGGSDSGCQRRWHTVTQKIQPGFIPGDRYSYFSAIVVASATDTPSTIASRMGTAISGITGKLGVWYSVGFSVTVSGDQLTIREPWQAGLNQVTAYRPHPICTPTPTPPITTATATPIPATPTPSPSVAPTPVPGCSGPSTSTDPCTCAAHSQRFPVGSDFVCTCDSGYHPNAGSTACVQDCSGPGAVIDGAGQCTCSGGNVNPTPVAGVCSCQGGSHPNAASTACVVDACSGPGGNDANGNCLCSANASPTGPTGNITCVCDPGYTPSGTTCVAAPTPSPTPVCPAPGEVDGSGTCVPFVDAHHACNAGGGGAIPSAVSSEVTGTDPAGQFNNAVNKKLACCLNYFNTGDAYVKFDCVENAKTSYADFNALWTSSDSNTDGGQLNAMVLTSSNGKPITGFYTVSGERCNEFSEFSSGTIQPGKVDAMMSVAQSNRTGQASGFDSQGKPVIAKPSAGAYTNIATKFNKPVPTSTADRRRCPILVRAATIVACPSNPQSPTAPKKTYEVSSGGVVTSRRCGMASSVQVQMRIEQVWEIAGQPMAAPIDTVLSPSNASTISVDQIIANKYGDKCPPGTTRQNDTCVY